MDSHQASGALQAHRFNPDTLRQQRLRRFGLSSATSRAIAGLAYGDCDDDFGEWIQLGTAVTTVIENAARAYEARS